jgi:Zn-dependent metalloprotease
MKWMDMSRSHRPRRPTASSACALAWLGFLALAPVSSGVTVEPDAAAESLLSADQRADLAALRAVDPRVSVTWDARERVPSALAGRLSAPSSAPAERVALDFVRTHQDLFRIANVDAELWSHPAERDDAGGAHVRLRQHHEGVPVFAGEVRVHMDAAGVVTAVEAELLPAPLVPTVPVLSAVEAVEAARKHAGGGSAGKDVALVVFDAGRLTRAARDERLAWRVPLTGTPDGPWVSFVDALNGDLVFRHRNRHEARDRLVRDHAPQVACRLGQVFYNEAGPAIPSPPPDATRAYDFGGEFHSYYLATHGRDSYDGSGVRMVAIVREPEENAFWDPECQTTSFGVGWATRDVVAHEWQHAVTEHTAGLVYACESGALNESMSDVFGAMVDREDWIMGEDLPIGYIRSLSNPKISRPAQPDTYAGADPCAGVHHNSGISNKVAYLVADGGTHYGVTVAGLGKEVMERIWYRALRFHMGPNTDFAGARAATFNAASELYGAGSGAVCSVANAWASVAVGSACGTNDAVFVSQSVPSTMVAGQSYSVSVTMRNTGTSTWTAATAYKLGSQNPQDNLTWGLRRVLLPTSVAPGGQVTFSFSVTAPSAAGSYNFQWRMLRELVEWFGAASPNVAITVQAPPANDAVFVSQSVPTTMTAGRPYSVSVTMKNTGSATWTTAAGYKLGSQNPPDNQTWGLSRVALSGNVAPGANHTFTFTVTAPSAPGTHNFQWRMLREGVTWFGSTSPNVAVSAVVAAPSGLGASYSVSTARIQLSWTDTNSVEDGTHLQFSYSGSAWSDLSPSTVGPNVTSWQSGPNPPTGSYQFRARAFKGATYSAWSNVASLVVSTIPTASIAWIQPAEQTWGPPGTLTAAGYAANGSGGVQLVWRERGDNGVWGAWQTVAWQPTPAADTTWSNTISSGNPTNKCHHFDAYVNYSGITSPVYHYTGWTGCP